MASRLEAGRYAGLLLRALRAHANGLTNPTEPFTPPGGITKFAQRAFVQAKLTAVSDSYVMNEVVPWLTVRRLIEREGRYGHRYRLIPQTVDVQTLIDMLGLAATATGLPATTPRSLLQQLSRALAAAQEEVKQRLTGLSQHRLLETVTALR